MTTELTGGSQILDLSLLSEDKPLLLLDVDGVLNVFPEAATRDRYYETSLASTTQGNFRVTRHKRAREWIDRLAEHFHLVWCTMWDDEANEHIFGPIGVPPVPYIPVWENSRMRNWSAKAGTHHKVPQINDYAQSRPLAWIDDELTVPDYTWAQARSRTTAPTKLECPTQERGMVERHVQRLVAWAQILKEPTS